MKKHTKIMSLLLAVVMIISAIPITASAATYDDLTYTVSNGKVTITACNTSAISVVIPETIEGYPVTEIGYYAFYDCTSLTSVAIPNSVTSIGDHAFMSCASLASVTIPNSVTSIGDEAFYNCKSITSLTIPNSVTNIGTKAFALCKSLTHVTISDSVTNIGDEAFWTCTALRSITVDANNKNYSTDEYGVLFNKDKNTLIQYPVGNTRISYVIPDSVNSISLRAFQDCSSLASITIPDSVTSIGFSAFSSCKNLTNATIGNSVTNIDNYAFMNCTSLPSVTIPNSVTNIGYEAFYGCDSLISVNIPDSVTNIDIAAFATCRSLVSITVDKNNKNYSSDEYGVLFNKDKTLIIQYPSGNPREYYMIPNSVTNIGDYAFRTCRLIKNITIPESVTSIGECAFLYCYALENIAIPNSVTNIDLGAFEYCTSLASITINNSECEIYDSRGTIYSSATIYGYCGSTAQAYAEKYDRNFVAMHDYTSEITTPATHLTEGVMTYTCACGDTYTETIAKTTEHTYNTVVTAPNCTEKGYTTYTCECGDTYVADYVDATGHNYVNSECAGCGDIKEVVADKSENTDCSCSCHSNNPFTKVIYKFIIVLCKLLRLNHRQICGCGIAHW